MANQDLRNQRNTVCRIGTWTARSAGMIFFFLLVLVPCGDGFAQEDKSKVQQQIKEALSKFSKTKSIDDQQEDEPEAKLPEERVEYMGRRIARTMHYTGAEWLTRDSREREERCSLLLTNLGLKQGQTVCDMGCGNGYYVLPIAEMIGEKGRVLAVDVQPEMLELLRARMEGKGLTNITPILGSFHEPYLPAESCDLILLVDVYHEFSYPELMLAAMRKALKPGGRIALVEYRMEDDEVPIKKLHKMSKKQILKEYLPNGFKLVEEFDELPWQHVMFFEKDE